MAYRLMLSEFFTLSCIYDSFVALHYFHGILLVPQLFSSAVHFYLLQPVLKQHIYHIFITVDLDNGMQVYRKSYGLLISGNARFD